MSTTAAGTARETAPDRDLMAQNIEVGGQVLHLDWSTATEGRIGGQVRLRETVDEEFYQEHVDDFNKAFSEALALKGKELQQIYYKPSSSEPEKYPVDSSLAPGEISVWFNPIK